MRCEEVREIVADHLAGTLDKAIETELSEHLNKCMDCRRELAEVQSIWAELESVPAPPMEVSKVRAAVLEAAGPMKYRFDLRRWEMRRVLKAAAIILILAGLAAGASLWLSERTEKDSAGVLAPGHVRGDATAPVTLLEYGDYECLPCGSYEPIIGQLLKKYPEALKFEFRHFPLTRIHPNALLAAKAAEAAGEQGQFWGMHDGLMASRPEWAKNPEAEAMFIEMAKRLGLDLDRFHQSLQSSETESEILKEAAKAQADGIAAAPTFYLNGKKIEHAPIGLETFDQLIIDELKRLKMRSK